MQVISIDTKTCTKCKESKTVDCFYKDKSVKGGLQWQCKLCASAAGKIYYNQNKERLNADCKQYYLNNTEKMNAQSKQYRLDNPEEITTYKKQYCLDNTDQIKAYKKQYSMDNAEKLRAGAKQWRVANPEKRRQNNQVRRARKLENGVFKILDKEIATLYSSPCIYCGSTEQIQMDHVIPIKKGGTHGIGNLVPACAKCNGSKSDKLLIEWKVSLKWAI